MRHPAFKTLLFVLTFAALSVAMDSQVLAASTNHTIAKQAIMIDYDTGMVLFEKSAHVKMPTSSMSKVMTAYVVFEALKDGRLRLDTELPVSEKAWRKGGSKMFVEVGDRVAVEDLLQGVLVQSGNDATIVLAEGLAGSEDNFAAMLNDTALKLGMKDSHFMNASGWPDPDHYSTAHDLALLAMKIYQNFPEHYSIFSEKEFTYNNIKQPNRNPLLYRDIGVDGLKTGHTEAGGYGLMATGTRNGRRVFLVVNGLPSEKDRAQEGARLIEWGLRGFENKVLFKQGEAIGEAKVAFGKEETVALTVDEDIFITIPSTLRNDLDVTIQYQGPLVAPVKGGQEIGKLIVKIPRGETLEYAVKTQGSVKKIGFFSSLIMKIKFKLGMAQDY